MVTTPVKMQSENSSRCSNPCQTWNGGGPSVWPRSHSWLAGVSCCMPPILPHTQQQLTPASLPPTPSAPPPHLLAMPQSPSVQLCVTPCPQPPPQAPPPPVCRPRCAVVISGLPRPVPPPAPARALLVPTGTPSKQHAGAPGCQAPGGYTTTEHKFEMAQVVGNCIGSCIG
jgi:hypothetical protein